MSETEQKRRRDEPHEAENDFQHQNPKRQKYLTQVPPIVEQEGVDSNQDLSDIFQSLEQELSSDSTSVDPLQNSLASDNQTGGSATPENDEEEEGDDGVRMMRRLLEASDDELGIPNRVECADEESNSGEVFDLGEGLWEFEDYAANYYDLLQSELFS